MPRRRLNEGGKKMRTSAHNIKAQDVEMGGSGPRRRLVPDSWSTSTSTLLLEAVV